MKKKKVPLYRLFPSIITIAALCMGLTGIKYVFENNFEMAVIMVLIACVMDGIDGPSARFLKSSSDFGAQLDSLCDLVNFGVVPAIIIYKWRLYEIGGLGWAISLIYASCTALRLARYNIESTAPGNKVHSYFYGISSPCAAILALSPLMLTFQVFDINFFPIIIGLYIVFIALMMVSRIPTISTKGFQVKKRDIPFIIALGAIVVAGTLLMPWKVIPMLSIIYIFSIPLSWYHFKKKSLFSSLSNKES